MQIPLVKWLDVRENWLCIPSRQIGHFTVWHFLAVFTTLSCYSIKYVQNVNELLVIKCRPMVSILVQNASCAQWSTFTLCFCHFFMPKWYAKIHSVAKCILIRIVNANAKATIYAKKSKALLWNFSNELWWSWLYFWYLLDCPCLKSSRKSHHDFFLQELDNVRINSNLNVVGLTKVDNYLTMSRSSMRMKHYRPMSADFTKSSSNSSALSNVFGLAQDANRDGNKSGVLLINCKFLHFKTNWQESEHSHVL